ncbi:major facilitator superfamily domain-containing protein [Penicillium waksmanii]|uniref:major facilitator superfamily domain-containing protein n=1 Tax=Penicillium waksmanii TaxID=69791 RepID=UPI0025469B77|nr:major facilitator superfamily domain-containing protein [Penicillium waksmanii]KAJ5973965.1 major facilitator superfamily domain-containing protein [Penicillium waksmanii]
MAADDPNLPIRWDGALHGLYPYLGTAGLGVALFLTGIEATIVSTSLVTITNDLQNSSQSSWVITSYLLTYTGSLLHSHCFQFSAPLTDSIVLGFLIIWSNGGNLFGVKRALLTSLFIFTVFSGGCAGAQSLSALCVAKSLVFFLSKQKITRLNYRIICRAFQGLGGAGVYTLTLFSLLRIYPYERFGMVSSIAGGIISLGLVLGPLFGGAISNSGAWRWVFLYNVPAGALAWLVILTILPDQFPDAPQMPTGESTSERMWVDTRAFFYQLDVLGAFLVLTTCSFLIAALQEGNFEYLWSSGLVISFLVISGVAGVTFVWWEWFVDQSGLKIVAVFPWRLTRNRIFMGVALCVFLLLEPTDSTDQSPYSGFFTTGLPMTVCIIEIPQRFQIVNQSSPLGAGVKLLSFALSCPLGIIGCSILAGRLMIPFCYIALIGIACEVTGIFLFSEIPSTTHLWPGQFGYLVLAGLGVGLAVSAFYMAVSLVVDLEDQSTAMGIGIQLRMLGGVLGVAASTTILNHYLKSRLSHSMRPEELSALLKTTESIKNFSPEIQLRAREVYALAYSMQMKLAGAFSVAQLLAVAMIWKRQNVRYSKH